MKEMEKNLLPLNLQFFADDPGNAGDGAGNPPDNDGGDGGNDGGELTIEELKAQLEISKNAAEASEKARKKDKEALDRALKDVARLKKEAMANKTDAEIEAENKRLEAEKLQEELTELRDYKQRNEAKERYLMQGMNPEMAQKAAEAEVTHDMDSLMEIQKQHTEALIKAKEAEWKKTRPQANVGDGSYPNMTKEEIMAIEDDGERQKAIAANMHLFT